MTNKNTTNNVGIPNITAPERVCEDKHCPFHGELPLRGKILRGKVVSKKQHKSAVIRREFDFLIPKYKRYERRNARHAVHIPECLEEEINVGDMVRAAECRKISKTKALVVIGKVK